MTAERTKLCEGCGKIFTPPKGNYNKTRFCGRSCASKTSLTKKYSTVAKTCEVCGQNFARIIRPSGFMEAIVSFNSRRTCSWECRNKLVSGVKRTTDPNRQTLLKWARNFKKSICERCGVKNKLVIHHKDRDWRNNALDNLETLCNSCHRKEHDEEIRQARKRCRKLTDEQVDKVRKLRQVEKVASKELAAQFGVSTITINKIISYREEYAA